MTAGKRRRQDAARLAAAEVLHGVLEEGAYANLLSIRTLEKTELRPIDRRFASALIYGTLSRIYSIDWLLSRVSHRAVGELDPWVRTLLRMGVWQIIWARSVPAPSAIDETVRLAGDLAGRGATAYINATLRRLSDDRPELPAKSPYVLYSLSPEIFGYLRKWFGPDEAASLAETFLHDDIQVTARTNLMRCEVDELTAVLLADGVTASPGQYCPAALRLDLAGQSVRSLAAWQQGLMTIQDEAAMLTGLAAAPQQGQRIIDLCAAPGGKTTHLAELTRDSSEILAFDSHPERLRLVSDNAARLGLQNIKCQVGDATGIGADPGLAGTADLVLTDVPCSGLGLLGRKPEIRLNMTHEKIIGLYPLQAAILDYAATLVKPGGVLMYSTCTINPAENIERVQSFLTEQAGSFQPEPLNGSLPAGLLEHPDLAAQAAQGWIQLLPHRHGLDGFFIARLRRVT